MGTMQNKKSVKFITAVTFLLMVIVNGLANILPINGVNTGQVSDSYPNLFAPAGWTFAIWGLIYLLLACYTLYQIGFFHNDWQTANGELLRKIGIIFSVSSLANALWIFSWHYYQITLSLVLMLVILVCLILINRLINQEYLVGRERFFIRLPFSIYFGWITVATIANVTTFLVSIGWDRFGLTEVIWAVIIIFVGMVIGLAVMIKNKDAAYGLVLIWAYGGILSKHTSSSGFANQYPAVIFAVIACLVLFVIGEIYVLFFQKKYQ